MSLFDKPKRGRPKKESVSIETHTMIHPKTVLKRAYTVAPITINPGVECVHCGERYGHLVTNTYPNGNQRRVCGKCGKPFVSRKLL